MVVSSVGRNECKHDILTKKSPKKNVKRIKSIFIYRFQIIHLISVIKESSQPSVSEVLHQILDILRNSELYAPSDFPNRSRDPMLSDFVEGLVTVQSNALITAARSYNSSG